MTYFDSSALIKRYHEEAGTRYVNALMEQGAAVFTSVFAFAEIHAALARERRALGQRRERIDHLISRFDADWPSFEIVQLTPPVLDETRRLLHQHQLKPADGVHLASALVLAHRFGTRPLSFVCADRALNEIAAREGLRPVDPAGREDGLR